MGSLGSSVLGNALKSKQSDKESARNLANSKDLAQYQHKLALGDYALKRNDYISDALLGDMRAVQSRQNAGLSTAFSQGFSPVQPLGGDVSGGYMQSATPSNVAANLGVENPFSAQNQLIDAQLENIKADTNKKNVDAGLTDTQRVDLQNKIDLFNETKDTQVKILSSTLRKMLNEEDLPVKEKARIDALINNLTSSTNLNIYELQHIKPAELERLGNESLKILSDIGVNSSQISLNNSIRALNKVKEHFASMGIGVGSTLIDTALGILSSPNGGKLFEQVKTNLTGLLTTLLGVGRDVAGGSGNNVINRFNEIRKDYAFSKIEVDAISDYLRGDVKSGATKTLANVMLRYPNFFKKLFGY